MLQKVLDIDQSM